MHWCVGGVLGCNLNFVADLFLDIVRVCTLPYNYKYSWNNDFKMLVWDMKDIVLAEFDSYLHSME